MKSIIGIALLLLIIPATLQSCDSSRSNTQAERDATYVEDGDTINPREGEGEGTKGHKFMETQSADSASRIEQ